MNKQLLVRVSKEIFEPFNPEKIVKSLMNEVGLSKSQAEKIAEEIKVELSHLNLNFISSPLIREMVNVKLLEHGFEEARKAYTRVGLPVSDVDKIIAGNHWYSRENANLQHNPETVHKLLADSLIRQYTLLKIIPLKLSDMHMQGAIHIHELEYFPTRPFCFSHDARLFFKQGFIADGTGTHTAVAGPAKHPEVALLHALKVLQASQVNMGGGQGLHNFNIFMAPYITSLDYGRVKQLAQMMFFELGEMYVARGGQVVFSSISLEPGVPKLYEKVPAIGPSGKVLGVYGDYEDEARSFFKAIMEVAYEGDYMGKPFNWPKLEVRLDKALFDRYGYEYLLTSKLASKFGATYYFNASAPYMPGDYICTQCCRYFMQHKDWNDEADLYNGTLRGGVVQNITVNLPQCAYEAKGDDGKLLEKLRERFDASKAVGLMKLNEVKKRIYEGFLPFLSRPIDENPYTFEWYDYEYDDGDGVLKVKNTYKARLKGTPYFEPDRQAVSIGVLGLNEMLKVHTGFELHEDKDSWRLGLKVIKHARDIVDEYSKEEGRFFSLTQSPAESCSHRLALIDLKSYGNKAFIQGNPKESINENPPVYYTNSTHVRVSAQIDLVERIQIEASFHPLFNGGAIMHIFMSESTPDPTSLWSFTKRIATQSLASYFAYTKDLTICKNCGMVQGGLLKECPECGAEGRSLEHWSRITGYYQEVSGWNAGKIQELAERHRYTL